MIEYLESLDSTGLEWTITVEDITIDWDLVIVRFSYSGTRIADTGDDADQVD